MVGRAGGRAVVRGVVERKERRVLRRVVLGPGMFVGGFVRCWRACIWLVLMKQWRSAEESMDYGVNE